MLYALVNPAGEILEYRTYDAEPEGTAVAANKPRLLPVVQQPPGFDAATQVLGDVVDTVEDGRVRRTNAVRLKTDGELAAERGAKVAALQAEASRRILERFPIVLQMNMMGRALQLIDIRSQRDLTPLEDQEQDELRAVRAAIDAIRDRSNQLEAQIPDDPAGVLAFDPLDGWD